MKKPGPDIIKKLAAYSVLANYLMATGTHLYSQVVYNDIVPDSILDLENEHFFIDIDNNGTTDFQFDNYSFTASWTYSSEVFFSFIVQDLLARPLNDNNAFAGISVYINTSSEGFIRYYPSALEVGILLNKNIEWQTDDVQVLAIMHVTVGGDEIFSTGGIWVEGYSDKYLGIRFTDLESRDYFGWIRCDVLDAGRTLVIKDFAYETEAGAAIRTGSKTSIKEEPLSVINYVDRDLIHITFTREPEENVNMKLFDVNGQLIISRILSIQYNIVEVNVPTGYYILKLESPELKLSEKIFMM
ncbi:MAG: T9SS type A sorting domain-containing protein [Chitinophagales bacterium]